ncbi:hypothetical protein ABIC47_001403, partial [Leifsonia sp. 563]|uniref:chaplin family protein n=1 Tax=Leifsonia sp. 563 TaxID=3156412 RepID=UPI0033937D1D
MNKYVSRGMWFTLCVGGLWLAGTAAANAAEAPSSDGVASGDQAVVGVTVPVSLSGNGISVLGDSTSSGSTAAAPAAPAAPSVSISPDSIGGVLSGDQAVASVSVPVTVAGNSVSVLGDSTSSGSDSAAAPAPADSGASATSDGSDGVASGIQAPVAVDVPVTAGGNAISVLGDSTSTDSSATAPAAGSGSSATASSSGSDGGLLSDIQAPIDAAVPVTVGGNAISVLGDSQSSGSETTAPAAGSGSTATSGSGSDGGLLSGIQAPIDAAVPVTAGGNAVSVVGDSTTSGSDTAAPAAGSGSTTSGSGSDGGILSGVQAPVDAAVPVTAGGNAVSVVGDSTTSGSDTAAPAA